MELSLLRLFYMVSLVRATLRLGLSKTPGHCDCKPLKGSTQNIRLLNSGVSASCLVVTLHSEVGRGLASFPADVCVCGRLEVYTWSFVSGRPNQ